MHFPSTCSALLSRLRNAEDQAAWQEFDANYRPLILEFCRRQGLSATDAEDIAQQVMTSLSHSLPRFLYDPGRGRFRNYLLRCTKNSLIDWLKCPSRRHLALDTSMAGMLSAEEQSPSPEETAIWEKEWVAHHYRRAMATLRKTFAPQSVAIFERMVEGAGVAELATEYNISEDAINKIRQRVRARMEELIAEQVRDEDEPS